jgi:hypothetical protein
MAVIALQQLQEEPYPELCRRLLKVRKGSVKEVNVPDATYLFVQGESEPFGEEFSKAAEALFSVAYAIKFLPKGGCLPNGYIKDYAVGPLEALYPFGHDSWNWKLMLMQPPFVDGEVLEQSREALAKRRRPRYERVGVKQWEEGRAYQTLHVGPHSGLDDSARRLNDAIRDCSLSKYRYQHEIYLSDPMQLEDKESRIILRYPILDPLSLSQ